MTPDFPETRNSLLLRIQDPSDRDAWDEFSTIYSPVAFRIARSHGFQDADAEDLAQRMMIAVSHAIGRWEADPDRAKFRTWLSRVIRNAIIDELRSKRPDAPAGGSSLVEKLSQHPAEQFETREHARKFIQPYCTFPLYRTGREAGVDTRRFCGGPSKRYP